MAGEHYIGNTDGIVINNKIIATFLKTTLKTLDQKLYDILNGIALHAYMRLGNFSDVGIVSGAVTLTGMCHTLVSESGTTDDLNTINITPTGIQMVILRAAAGHTITLKHNAGDIKFASGTDLILQDDKRLVLFHDGSTFYDTYTSSAGGGGGGGVSSVGLSLPAIFSVSGSPVTGSGTLTGALATQVKNKIWAGPTTGADAAPTFRSQVLADLPAIADQRLLGNSSGGSAVPQEISLGSGLSMASGILSASGGGSGDGGSSGNIITNGDFAVWENGISIAPNNWASFGSGATVAQEGTIKKHGDYSAKVTRVGNDCHFSQDVYAKGGKTYMQGRTYIFGAWVYATVASRVRLRMYDGTTTTYSSYHSGGSAWEWLTVTAAIAGGATAVNFGLAVDTGNTSGYIDGATVSEGSVLSYPSLPAFNVNSIPKRATMWHDEATVIAGGALIYSIVTTHMYNGELFQSAAADHDSFTNSFYIAAGTYTLYFLGVKTNTSGKIDWKIDGVSVLTGQDWYNASTVVNTIQSVSVTIVGDGDHVIQGTVNGKNAAPSGGYAIALTKYWLKPTVD